MRFIAIVISLILDRVLGLGAFIRCYRCVNPYLELLGKGLSKINCWHGWLGVIAALIPVVLITGFVQWLVAGWWLGILALIFGVLVLLYCLGPDHVQDQYQEYQAALARGDNQVAKQKLRDLLGNEPPQNSDLLARAISEAIFKKANQNVFAVVFWFMILGPVGAILYRFTLLLKQHAVISNSQIGSFAKPAELLQNVLDWVPVRLLTMSYALVGDFIGGFTYWWEHLISGLSSNDDMLVNCGLAALAAEETKPEDAVAEHAQVIALIDRALIVWVAILGIATLAVWLF